MRFFPTMKAIIKKTKPSVDKNMKTLESLHIAHGNVKWCSNFGRQFGNSS